MQEKEPGRGVVRRMMAIVAQRCPRCLRGGVFHGWVEMHETCPACGHLFQREQGYFLGAMYVSYALGCGVVSAGYFAGSWAWPTLPPVQLCLLLLACYVPLMPVLFRYSRIVFMHLDYLVGQGPGGEAGYVEARQRALSTRGATSPESRDDRTPRG
ncbi:MAG: DUF983 domain-containing protein [Gemmataceae bacterium]